jgi:hypothetical protein
LEIIKRKCIAKELFDPMRIWEEHLLLENVYRTFTEEGVTADLFPENVKKNFSTLRIQ